MRKKLSEKLSRIIVLTVVITLMFLLASCSQKEEETASNKKVVSLQEMIDETKKNKKPLFMIKLVEEEVANMTDKFDHQKLKDIHVASITKISNGKKTTYVLNRTGHEYNDSVYKLSYFLRNIQNSKIFNDNIVRGDEARFNTMKDMKYSEMYSATPEAEELLNTNYEKPVTEDMNIEITEEPEKMEKFTIYPRYNLNEVEEEVVTFKETKAKMYIDMKDFEVDGKPAKLAIWSNPDSNERLIIPVGEKFERFKYDKK